MYLGNIDARRDWGHARDYVEGMWRILQHEEADDFCLATGENHSVREFVELVFSETGIDLEWKGTGIDEKGIDPATGKTIIEIDRRYFRPTEVETLLGDASKARRLLGWTSKTSFRELVTEMVQADIQESEKEALLKRKGFKVLNCNE